MKEKVNLTTDELRTAYNSGFDTGMYGANTTNSHFSIFSTPEKTKAWEVGKDDGDLMKANCEAMVPSKKDI